MKNKSNKRKNKNKAERNKSVDFPRIKILNKSEKRKIEKELQEQFGIEGIPGNIITKGKERLFLFTGDMEKFPLNKLEDKIIIEKMGVYFAKKIIDNGEERVKLSIEGTQILSNQVNKNIFELNKLQLQDWMEGKELNVETNKRGLLVIKYKEDFLGSGKASEKKVTNFVPKNRRLKEKI